MLNSLMQMFACDTRTEIWSSPFALGRASIYRVHRSFARCPRFNVGSKNLLQLIGSRSAVHGHENYYLHMECVVWTL